MSIKCGRCKGRHQSVAAVQLCHGGAIVITAPLPIERECGSDWATTDDAAWSFLGSPLPTEKPVTDYHPGILPAGEPTEAGMYLTANGNVYKVQAAVHGSGRLYAKLMVKLDEPTKSGKTHSFRYVQGAIRKLRASEKMTLEDAKKWGLLYGTCVRCGLTLTREDSIERGMGTTCYAKAKNGAW